VDEWPCSSGTRRRVTRYFTHNLRYNKQISPFRHPGPWELYHYQCPSNVGNPIPSDTAPLPITTHTPNTQYPVTQHHFPSQRTPQIPNTQWHSTTSHHNAHPKYPIPSDTAPLPITTHTSNTNDVDIPHISLKKYCSPSASRDAVEQQCVLGRASLWQLKNKNQLDATYYFLVLLIGSTCFGHYYAHHQELTTKMFECLNETTNVVIKILAASSWWWA